MSDTINGLWVALATPIAADGTVDHAGLVRHAKALTAAGCDGFVPFGTTGEGTSFSAAERLAAIEAMLAGGIEPGRIGLGTGCPAITDTIALTRGALALGLHHVLILPPYFYRDVDAQGIEDAFAAIIDGVGDSRLRTTLYSIPQVSGVGVPPLVAANLRQRFGVMLAGVKDSSAVFENFRAFRAAAPELAIVVGNEADIGRAATGARDVHRRGCAGADAVGAGVDAGALHADAEIDHCGADGRGGVVAHAAAIARRRSGDWPAHRGCDGECRLGQGSISLNSRQTGGQPPNPVAACVCRGANALVRSRRAA
jgi:hypothetical protein